MTVKEMTEAECVCCGTQDKFLYHDYYNKNDKTRSWFCHRCFKNNRKQEKPKCLTEGCECDAAFNDYYPNSEGGQYWTLCDKCYKEDQEDDEAK